MFEAKAIVFEAKASILFEANLPRPVTLTPKPKPVIMIVEKNKKMTFLIKIQLLN